jgi:hypothetical protein
MFTMVLKLAEKVVADSKVTTKQTGVWSQEKIQTDKMQKLLNAVLGYSPVEFTIRNSGTLPPNNKSTLGNIVPLVRFSRSDISNITTADVTVYESLVQSASQEEINVFQWACVLQIVEYIRPDLIPHENQGKRHFLSTTQRKWNVRNVSDFSIEFGLTYSTESNSFATTNVFHNKFNSNMLWNVKDFPVYMQEQERKESKPKVNPVCACDGKIHTYSKKQLAECTIICNACSVEVAFA